MYVCNDPDAICHINSTKYLKSVVKGVKDALNDADIVVSRWKKLLRCSRPSEFISKMDKNYS